MEGKHRIYTRDELPESDSSGLEEFFSKLKHNDMVSGDWLNSLKPTSIDRNSFMYSLNGRKYLFEAVNPNESASGVHIHPQYRYIKV